MSNNRTISNNFLKLNAHFECSGHPENYLKAYQDSGGVWTIGIGTTKYPDGTKVKEGDAITLDEAYEYRKHDLFFIQDVVNDWLPFLPLDQHQFDAICDFVYNEGAGKFKDSTLRKLLNTNPNNYKAVIPELLKWVYQHAIVEPGLVRRRKAEAYLYVYGELKFYFTHNDNII